MIMNDNVGRVDADIF